MSGDGRLNRKQTPSRSKIDLSIILLVLFALAGIAASLEVAHFQRMDVGPTTGAVNPRIRSEAFGGAGHVLLRNRLPARLRDLHPHAVATAPDRGALCLDQSLKREFSELTDRETLDQERRFGAPVQTAG
jgi:hypothetical protein